MMDNAKRPNLAEIVSVVPPNPYQTSIETGAAASAKKNITGVSSLASIGAENQIKPKNPPTGIENH